MNEKKAELYSSYILSSARKIWERIWIDFHWISVLTPISIKIHIIEHYWNWRNENHQQISATNNDKTKWKKIYSFLKWVANREKGTE